MPLLLMLRITSAVTDDKDYLSEVSYRGKPPKLAILVDIHEVYFHCAKALIRSRLWDSSLHMDRSEMPTLGNMLADQILGEAASAEIVCAADEDLAADERDNRYHN